MRNYTLKDMPTYKEDDYSHLSDSKEEEEEEDEEEEVLCYLARRYNKHLHIRK